MASLFSFFSFPPSVPLNVTVTRGHMSKPAGARPPGVRWRWRWRRETWSPRPPKEREKPYGRRGGRTSTEEERVMVTQRPSPVAQPGAAGGGPRGTGGRDGRTAVEVSPSNECFVFCRVKGFRVSLPGNLSLSWCFLSLRLSLVTEWSAAVTVAHTHPHPPTPLYSPPR